METSVSLFEALARPSNLLQAQIVLEWFLACLCGDLDRVKLLSKCSNANCRTPSIILADTNKYSEAGLHFQPGEPLFTAYVTPLHVASFSGHLNIVKFLVDDANCDLNCKNHKGLTPLHMACHEGHLHIVEYLFEHNCDHLWNMQCNMTPFAMACRNGHLNVAKNLIKHNPKCVTVATPEDMTPLHFACIGGHLGVVKFLIEKHNFKTECRNKNGLTPLHLACNYGHLETAKYLITEQNASPRCTSDTMTTPLHSASWSGNLDLVQYLINEQQCDPCCESKIKRTPLHYACISGQLEVAKHLYSHLIEHQLHPERSDTEGNRPLHSACRYGHLPLVKYFVEVHCKVSCTSSRSGSYVADFIATYRNSHGQTPLHLACLEGHSHVVEHLVTQCNCNPNCPDETGMTPLHIVSKMGNLNLVKYLLKLPHSDSNSQTESGYTPLHLACLERHSHVVEHLVTQSNCNPNCPDETGMTPLHIVSKMGDLKLMKCLFKHSHCDPNSQTESGYTPLHLAHLKGHSHVVEYLVTQGNCSPNCPDETGMTPLHIVSKMGDLKLVKCLFKHPDCNPNSQTKCGYTPLHLACLKGHSHVVEYLVAECNCNPNCPDENRMTPLHIVSKMGDLKLMKCLFQHSHCDPNSQTKSGYTPLHFACEDGHLSIVEYITNKSSDPECATYTNSLSQTPLHLACLGGHYRVIEHLVTQCNCSPNCPDETGMTPLHIVSKMGDLILVKSLFKHPHCDPNSQNQSGKTPLHFAYWRGHSHVVKYLVTQGNCSPNCPDKTGMTPLHIVSKMGDLELVKCLFKHPHCDPNSQTKFGYTPLHFACKEGHLSIVKHFVIDKRSDPECETIDGNTPFMLACSSDHEDVAKFLLPRCDPLHLNKKGKNALVKSPAIRKAISHFYETKKKHPIESYIKIFVLGDSEAGKSTLVQALQGNQSLINLLIRRQVPENKVSKQTSGIDTFIYNSKSFGNVVIYDFAGQYEYYTSNAAFLQTFTSKSSGAIFLLVINANLENVEISRSLHYWLSFITDNWAHNRTKAHVFIVGSHTDKVEGDIEKVYSTMEKVAHSHDADYRHAGVVCLDCRCQSSELGHLCTRLAEECTKLRTDTIDGRCYVLYDYIQCTYLKQTCTLLELTQSLHDHPFLPSDPNDMLKLVKLLHDKGQVILLEDCKNPASSWVIDNVQLLLKTVVGTVFAPTDFKNHLQVPNEIGIVSQEQILEVFEGKEISLIIGFLEHFQFCHKVDPTSLGLDEKSTYFFPALVTKSRPTIVRNEEHLPHVDYHCVWCMQCSRQDNDQPKFLPARWLHVVLLQLAYKFVLPLEDRPHSIAEESVNLSSRSKIWKNGIFWCNEAGICTLFEATEHMHTVILIMSCPSNHEISCVRLRSELIHTILTAVEDICPQNTKDLREYIIDPVNPAELYNKQQLASNLYGVSIQSLVRNLVKERKFWEFPDPMETTRELLYFEPYIVFSRQAVEQLFSKENSQKVVSTEFIAQLALWASHYDDNNALQKIIRPYPHEIVDEDSFTVCKQTLESWKHRSGSKYATYQKLCHELGNYSIFKGRDPLVSY